MKTSFRIFCIALTIPFTISLAGTVFAADKPSETEILQLMKETEMQKRQQNKEARDQVRSKEQESLKSQAEEINKAAEKSMQGAQIGGGMGIKGGAVGVGSAARASKKLKGKVGGGTVPMDKGRKQIQKGMSAGQIGQRSGVLKGMENEQIKKGRAAQEKKSLANEQSEFDKQKKAMEATKNKLKEIEESNKQIQQRIAK